jgi:restriction system protein
MRMTAAPGSNTHVVFHYPPEVLQNLKDTIPLLCRSKKDVISFFLGAGVPDHILSDVRKQVQTNPNGISKFEIARTVLERLNAKKDTHLKELREVVRRVTEFEDYSTCWPSDQLKAKGLVAELRRVVEVKDSFTRMRIEREGEAKKAREVFEKKTQIAQDRREAIQAISRDLFSLFSEPNAQKRGKALEGILNRLFDVYGMKVREAFTVKGSCGEGVIEQIDGVVEIDGDLYLVEMKWWNTPIGTGEVSPHIVRIFNRGLQVKGIFISYTHYTDGAIDTCKTALAGGAVVALCTLKEIVSVLDRHEQGADLRTILRTKIHAALLDKKPWHECLG